MNLKSHLDGLKQRAQGAERAAGTAHREEMKLTELKIGTRARVVSVAAVDAAPPEIGRRLAELGFLPGESVRIVARGFLSREPLAVRVGTGTFALRSFEAACIRVCVEQTPAA